MAVGDFPQKIVVVTDENAEIPREGRFVDADEIGALACVGEEAAPVLDGHKPDRVDAVGEEGDEQLVEGCRLIRAW